MRKSRFDANGVELPDAGGLSGVKRMQMAQSAQPRTPRAQPASVAPAGYERPTAVARLMSAANPQRRKPGY